MFPLLNAIFAPLQKILIAGAVAGGLMLASYFYGVHEANEKHALIAAQQKAKDLVVIAATQAADDQQRHEDQNKIRELTTQIEEARRELSDKDRVCFEPADTDKLRQLWR